MTRVLCCAFALSLIALLPSSSADEVPAQLRTSAGTCISDRFDPNNDRVHTMATVVLPIFTSGKANACDDFPGAACNETPPSDPTGKVAPRAVTSFDPAIYQEQKKRVIALAEEWEKLPPSSRPWLDDYIQVEYTKKYKLQEKRLRVSRILSRVKKLFAAYFGNLTTSSNQQRISRLMEWVQEYEVDTADPIPLFMNTAIATSPMTVGGRLLESVESEAAWVLTLSHELGHIIEHVIPKKTVDCLESQCDLETRDEYMADWVGSTFLAEFLKSSSYSASEQVAMALNAARAHCGYGATSSGHPDGTTRMMLLRENPYIEKLACGKNAQAPRSSTYCTFDWSDSK